MTQQGLKNIFNDPANWETAEENAHFRFSRFEFGKLLFIKLEILTGFDDYQPGVGFVPTEKWRFRALWRVERGGRWIESNRTEAVRCIIEENKEENIV